jgi:hypothetical protein
VIGEPTPTTTPGDGPTSEIGPAIQTVDLTGPDVDGRQDDTEAGDVDLILPQSDGTVSKS